MIHEWGGDVGIHDVIRVNLRGSRQGEKKDAQCPYIAREAVRLIGQHLRRTLAKLLLLERGAPYKKGRG